VTKQVEHFDEESPAVASEAGLELAREWIETVASEIAVVTHVESSSRVRRIAKHELTTCVGRQRVIVDARAQEKKAGELIGGTKRIDVILVGEQMGIVSSQSILGIIQGQGEFVRRLISPLSSRLK
jgi:phosphomannomutase